MPITQAAKEPDFGLALLKKKCRESNSQLALLKKRCREPEVDEPPRNHACERANSAEGEKSFFWHTKNLMWPEPASNFGWKRWGYRPHLTQAGGYLKSVPPLPRPHHLKFWKGLVPLRRVKFLHLHPSLEHIALRVNDTGDGDWLWVKSYDFEESRKVYMPGE